AEEDEEHRVGPGPGQPRLGRVGVNDKEKPPQQEGDEDPVGDPLQHHAGHRRAPADRAPLGDEERAGELPEPEGEHQEHHEADGADVVQGAEAHPLLGSEERPPARGPTEMDEQQDDQVGQHPDVVRRAEAGPLVLPAGVTEGPPPEDRGDGQAGEQLEETFHGVPPSTPPVRTISTGSPARIRRGPSRNNEVSAVSPTSARSSASASPTHSRASTGPWRSVAATVYRPSARRARAVR